MRKLSVAFVLFLTAAVAGCADGGAAPSDEPAPGAFDDVVVTSSTGAIRGVVVDDAIVPLEGVLVTLAGGQEKSTDADGAFVFNGLQPGDYFLTASKAGYVAQQSAVTVLAGQEPPITKISLPADPAAVAPYYQEYVFEGFIQCSGTFVVVGFAACSVVDIVQEGITQDNFGITYLMEDKPDWMQSEMVWQSTQAAGNEMAVMYSWGDCDGFLCDHEAEGTSPVLLVATPQDIDVINDGDYNGTELFVRVFNRGLAETGGSVGLTVNQQFTIVTHMFYGYQPPTGWRFTEGGGVPQPPN